MKHLALFFVLAFVVGIAGCATEPESEFILNFSIAEADSIEVGDTVIIIAGDYRKLEELRPVIIRSDSETIRVLGSFVAGCHQQPDAFMKRQSAGVTLIVSWPPEGEWECPSVPGAFTYEARFTRVPRGNHRVVVEHTGDQLWGEGVVLEQQVQVP